jgi:hypothetical protein
MAPDFPKTVGRWKLESLLGEGSFGSVHLVSTVLKVRSHPFALLFNYHEHIFHISGSHKTELCGHETGGAQEEQKR